MPYYNDRWHLFSEQKRREFGEQRRADLSKKWHATWISKRGLKTERLWTDAAINRFLRKPRKAGAISAWLRKDVLAAEDTPDFKAWMAKRRAWLTAKGKLPGSAPPAGREIETPSRPDNVIPFDRACTRPV